MCDPDSAGLLNFMTPPLGIVPIFLVTYIWRVPMDFTFVMWYSSTMIDSQGPPSQMGSPMGSRTGSETPQAPMSGVVLLVVVQVLVEGAKGPTLKALISCRRY